MISHWQPKMKTIRVVTTFLALSFSLFTLAQEEVVQEPNGYIIDELYIFMHSGAGSNYRIIGSINAGSPLTLTGEQQNGYFQVVDDKNREGWVESKFITEKPGLRYVVAELNAQLAANSEQEAVALENLQSNQQQVATLTEQNEALSQQVAELNKTLSATQAKLQSQDMDIKKEWFFNGAIVLIIGLVIGIVLPFFTAKKRRVDSWH